MAHSIWVCTEWRGTLCCRQHPRPASYTGSFFESLVLDTAELPVYQNKGKNWQDAGKGMEDYSSWEGQEAQTHSKHKLLVNVLLGYIWLEIWRLQEA